MKDTKIANYMTRDIISCKYSDEITSAMNLLIKYKISAVPVLDNKKNLLGILSEKGCIAVALKSAFNEIWGGAVKDYMSTEFIPLRQGDSIFEAAKVLSSIPNRSCPVLDDDQNVVGVISSRDVLRAIQELS